MKLLNLYDIANIRRSHDVFTAPSNRTQRELFQRRHKIKYSKIFDLPELFFIIHFDWLPITIVYYNSKVP